MSGLLWFLAGWFTGCAMTFSVIMFMFIMGDDQ